MALDSSGCERFAEVH